MSLSPEEFYQKQIDLYSEKFIHFTKKTERISALRVIIFLVGLLIIYYSTTFTLTVSLITSLVFLISFGYIIYSHGKAHKKKDYYETLLKINQAELKALNGNYDDFKDGEEYNSPDHPYTDDLDLFGKNSLFQSLNRASTFIGTDKLASWFLNINRDKKQIHEKQSAIEELSKLVKWRQVFRTCGLLSKEKREDQKDVAKWAKIKPEFNSPIYIWLLIIIPIITFSLLFLSIWGILSERIFLLYVLIIPLGISYKNFKKVNIIHKQLGKKTDLLKKYSALFNILEDQTFSSDYLKKTLSGLHHNNESPSKVLKKLAKISSAFDNRLNMLIGLVLNVFFLWDLLQSIRLNYWKRKYGKLLPQWFEMISEFDALISLANFHYNHPENNFPIISKNEFFINAQDLGHPMILKNDRIDNDIKFNAWKNFIIITGANMAGKSTFLRTLGVNLILASTGTSVSAKHFEWSPVDIFTSLRTKDSLDKNESYFFAELKRLKKIIDRLNNNQPLFIILDEILKGTNSKDKQRGSMQLIEQLIGLNASGIIATHDLILGELIKTYPENIINKCFEVEIVNDKLVFDYKLKDGISQNMNATFLMKKMGITI